MKNLSLPTFIMTLSMLFAGLASADRESAKTLADRVRGSVSGMAIHPVWAPDDTAVYFHDAHRITRIDTATGKKMLLMDVREHAQKGAHKPARIVRIATTDAGDLAYLATFNDEYRPYRVEGKKPTAMDPEDDPFALIPRQADQRIRSRRHGEDTAILFYNNTGKAHQIFWVDPAGIRHPYASIEPGAFYRQHTFAGDAWVAGSLAFVGENEPGVAYLAAAPQEREERSVARADSPWGISFRGHNLYVKNHKTGKETQLTTDGTGDEFYGGPTVLSPDERYLLVIREKAGDNRHIDLIESAPSDQLQPRTQSIHYPKPGDRIAQRKPCLFDLQTMKQVPLTEDLFSNPWSVSEFHWAPDSERIFFVYNERGHQTARLLAIQARTGKVAVVTEEKSETFIDWTNKLKVQHLDETDEAIWMSERSGWNHLYLVDRKTGETSAITKGEWVVRDIERVDEENRQIWFRACGVYPGMDPYYMQYGRVSFDGSGLTWLTQGNGTHTVSFSPKGNYYVDSWSRINIPPVHELHRTSDGRRIMDLGKADAAPLLAIHPHLPEPFSAKGRDGTTDIYGVIFRPSDFDPKKKYPVIEEIYAGPQDFFVPKAFNTYHSAQQLAELGFIVVKIDGMGTNWRSKKFHDVCFKNLKDAGFPDRIAWMKAAAKKYPAMDLDRVGIYGTSAGGQSAMRAVIDHADFYKAAAADCGCHDNRMDKIWWNEQWMGWPVDESYAANSNMEDAHKLGGKLLLTVGGMDSNVDPSSTMQVVDELIKADKDFELMVFPSGGHGAGMGEYGTRLREAFFIRHLQ